MSLHLLGLLAVLVPQQDVSAARPMGFSAVSMTGKRVFVRDMIQDGPAFIYFIRAGDGVNAQFARQLNRVLASYTPSRAKWFGIINTDQARAHAWTAEFNPSYEVLRDENLSLIQLFGVNSSPALVLLGHDGKVVKQWSGYSGYWLKDINRSLADTEGVPMKKIDFSMTPSSTRYGVNYITRKDNG